MSSIVYTSLVDGTILTATALTTADDTLFNDYVGGLLDVNFSASDPIDGIKFADVTISFTKLIPTADVVRASADLNLAVAVADVTGATKTFTADVASNVVVKAVFYFDGIVAGSGDVFGVLNVDTVDLTDEVVIDNNSASAIAQTVSYVWVIPVAAGAHTFKLRGRLTADTGTEFIRATHTAIQIEVYAA